MVAGGEWLAFAHQFNPAFATEIWRIEPLPHQRIALYDMILTQDRRPVLGGHQPDRRPEPPGQHLRLDWDLSGRSERVDVVDPSTGTVLDSRTIPSFTGGVYLSWT